MLISTISTTIDHEIILGNGTYADSITITNTGAILSLGTDGIGIYVGPSISNAVIVNYGTIIGGTGGAGIYLNGTSATLTNTGLIEDGVAINGGDVDLYNSGKITGATGIDSGGTSSPNPAVTPLTDQSNACFATGTRLLTPRGDIRIEHLAIGDHVITLAGEDAPIIWIGRRRLDLRRHANPAAAQPILITAGALGDHLPCRDLIVSPGHGMFFNGCLVPASALVNRRTIIQLDRASVTYWHVELARHAIIFAEGAASESYLDCGNRGAFENAGSTITLHPDFATRLRQEQGVAPFIDDGPRLAAIRRQLAARLTQSDAKVQAAKTGF